MHPRCDLHSARYAESNEFTTFWASRSRDKVSDAATRLIALRKAEVITTPDADTFFQSLAEKVFALDEVYLAWVDGFRGQLVGFSRDGCAQAEHLAGFGDFQDQSFSIGGTDGEFHTALAQHENAARRLAFDEQYGALRISGGVLYAFKRLQRMRGQIAEDAVHAHFAGKTAFDDVHSVW